MTGNLSEQVRAYVRQIEAIEDEIAGLNTDKSEIYKSAKDAEIDVKALRRVVAYRRKRGKGADVEAEEQAFVEYLHMVENGLVRARVEVVEEILPHDAETGELLDEAAGEAQEVERRFRTPEDAGSIPAASSNAVVAQQVEQPICDRTVAGSIPANGPNFEEPDLPAFLDRRGRP